MKLVLSAALFWASATAHQLAAPNPELASFAKLDKKQPAANCAIFDTAAQDLATLYEQKLAAAECGKVGGEEEDEEKAVFSFDLAQVKQLYDASEKSLVDRALATALAVSGNQKSTEFQQFKNKVDLAKSLVKSSDVHDWSRFHNEAGIQALSIAVEAIVATARLTQEKLLSADEILLLANSFLSSTENAEFRANALHALNDDASGLPKPVKFSKSGTFPSLNYQLLDVFGDQVQTARFLVKIGSEQLDIPASGDVDFSSFDLSPGLHEYQLSVSGSDMYAGFEEKTLKVFVPSTEKVEIRDVQVKTIKKGQTKAVAGVTTTLGDKLVVSFTLSGNVNPHQAMVRFSLDDQALEGFALTKTSHAHPGDYSATIEMDKSESSVFSNVGGNWNIEILVADITMVEPIRHQVKDTVKILLSESETTPCDNFKPMKTINHIFPEAEARPPASLSMLFTALTLAPFALLIILWAIIGFNFKAFSFSLWSLLFHLSVGAILTLYVSYWLGMFNMFYTVRYLAIIGVILLISGNKHLNSIAKDRKILVSEEIKKKE